MTKLRSDAAVRRDLILDAADAVFSEHGVTAPLDLVVERAGVGRATLYRNFPDRGALMEALLERNLQALEEHATVHANRDDLLFLLLERIAYRIVESPAVTDYWRAVGYDHPIMDAVRGRVSRIFRAPVARAIDAGLCRPDLSLSDISLISGMLGAALRGRSPGNRRQLVKRALDLLRDGLAAPVAMER
ncbi:TetR/AcrR family transcriptional regulator [Noviherbaspirillum sp. Root189]|uniref:TetR/AcrR family transcriptional regulator n=1 Tax=Noviherbaspirillum sp. Root189 TaxID=1736487 RepID=UPI000709BF74|nr:TetR/AcrR family transcriptional regulator [Noviherbaspirillum sp. Root189]KRB89952.1 TetR family transcriptional regulator [Noviherbaspirillum sp. Root189]